MSVLACFGLGYSALCFARRLQARGWEVRGTTRSADKAETLSREGLEMSLFGGDAPCNEIGTLLDGATHVLVSIAPGKTGDPVLAHHAGDIAGAPSVKWIGYLSTVGVYGDHAGAWVDETAPLLPRPERAVNRVEAEKAWLAFGERSAKPVHVFRLAGIYGPGRGPMEKVLQGEARRIVKPGQVFNRIHVEDIANVLEASIRRPRAGAIYNVSDDEPAPPQDVVAHACRLAGVAPPPELPIEEADLTPMGRSFYGENKRVSNELIKLELGVRLDYPTYREGLASLLDEPAGSRTRSGARLTRSTGRDRR